MLLLHRVIHSTHLKAHFGCSDFTKENGKMAYVLTCSKTGVQTMPIWAKRSANALRGLARGGCAQHRVAAYATLRPCNMACVAQHSARDRTPRARHARAHPCAHRTNRGASRTAARHTACARSSCCGAEALWRATEVTNQHHRPACV